MLHHCFQKGCTFEDENEKPEICGVCKNPMIYEQVNMKTPAFIKGEEDGAKFCNERIPSDPPKNYNAEEKGQWFDGYSSIIDSHFDR